MRLGRPSNRPGTSRWRCPPPFWRKVQWMASSLISFSACSSSSQRRVENRECMFDGASVWPDRRRTEPHYTSWLALTFSLLTELRFKRGSIPLRGRAEPPARRSVPPHSLWEPGAAGSWARSLATVALKACGYNKADPNKRWISLLVCQPINLVKIFF